MAADKLPENTPKFICPKVWDFDEKRLYWASVVSVLWHYNHEEKEKIEKY